MTTGVTNFKLNKYGMPLYDQTNISSSFNFDEFGKGVEIQMLIADKSNSIDTSLDPKFIN